MGNATVPKSAEDYEILVGDNGEWGRDVPGVLQPIKLQAGQTEPSHVRNCRRLVSTKELAEMWGVPESTLRYWRCAELGPPYVKLGGRIKYDLADVEIYVRANKRMPSVRAHGG
jgi:hypothetical protein